METIKRYGFPLLAALLAPVTAIGAELAPGHPQDYVVQRGDTLWDISARFLQEPWLWPEIWDRNPQIDNPHLIYPGDIISLVYVDGKPRLRVTRAGEPVPKPKGIVKYSPQVRATERDAAITTVPLDAIQQFLTESRVVSKQEIEAAPYVVSLGKEHILGGTSYKAYVRGLPENGPRRYGVYRRGKVYTEPVPGATPTTVFKGGALGGARTTGEVLGYEALHVADAVVTKLGDPATLVLSRAVREVRAGDRLLPAGGSLFGAQFMPRAYGGDKEGKIIDVVDAVSQIGQFQIVAISLGTDDGVDTGHVLGVDQAGVKVVDPVYGRQRLATWEPPFDTGAAAFPQVEFEASTPDRRVGSAFEMSQRRGVKVTLPEERAGVVMVFRPFDRVSYALVMEATRAINIYDNVGPP